MSWDQEAREAMHQRHGCVKTRDSHIDQDYCYRHHCGWLRDVDACAHVDAAVEALAPVVAREVARVKAEALREFGPWVQQENACDPEDECPEGTCRLCDLLLAVYSDANDRADAIDTEVGGS